MKKSRKKILYVIFMIVILFQASIANAYTVEYIPISTSLTFRPHVSLGIMFDAATTGAFQTWNNAPGNFSFVRGTVNHNPYVIGDTQSDVAMDYFSELPGWDNNWAAGCARALIGNRIAFFDILYNLEKPFGNGKSQDFADRQGVGTHEFGHALGLGHVYGWSHPVPTMYLNIVIPSGENISFDMRTLEADDRAGKQYIANQI